MAESISAYFLSILFQASTVQYGFGWFGPGHSIQCASPSLEKSYTFETSFKSVGIRSRSSVRTRTFSNLLNLRFANLLLRLFERPQILAAECFFLLLLIGVSREFLISLQKLDCLVVYTVQSRIWRVLTLTFRDE